ncbi:MAG: 3-dehydroquinate synthase [Armatimonadetes bacterium]|nr:3-dehydroquinate synthase [Armatimonadota bacterium]
MKTVSVPLGERSYAIYIEPGLLDSAGEWVARDCKARRGAVVTNPKIASLYGERVRASLERAGITVGEPILIPPGERRKSLRTVEAILRELAARSLDRHSAVVALGGGIVGDVAGFAAATYLRGIEFVQIATTLIAQVDSSLGGKTGVNLPEGKNLAGAFHQPRCVLIDPETLTSLPRREVRAGMAEVIKYGVIADADLFRLLEKKLPDAGDRHDRELLAFLIERSCQIKADVVGQDETESGLRAILNYGHTVGHALESATGYRRYLHGEAVALGMVAAACIAEKTKMAQEPIEAPLSALLRRAGLPVRFPPEVSSDHLMEAMRRDKKVKDGRLRFVLPVRMGQVVVRGDVPPETVKASLEELAR